MCRSTDKRRPMTARLTRSLLGFVAGFFGTMIFHQAAVGLLWLLKVIPRTPWSMAPTAPLGVPAILSLSFWGGLWGIALIACLDRFRVRHAAVFALVFGALLPSLVAWYVVSPLKGRPMPTSAQAYAIGLFVNAAWGLGTWAIVRGLSRARR